MKNQIVRCWKVGYKYQLYITYPDCGHGYNLICCKNCGKIYAVDITAQLYLEPDLDKQLEEENCLQCEQPLKNNWLKYPDNYIDENGKVAKFTRPFEYPDDEYSITAEFPEVYSKQ